MGLGGRRVLPVPRSGQTIAPSPACKSGVDAILRTNERSGRDWNSRRPPYGRLAITLPFSQT